MLKKIKVKLQNDGHLKEVLSGSAITFVLKMTGMLLGYIVVLIISRKYGADGMGIYSLIVSIITFFVMMSVVGMNFSILRYVGQFNKHSEKQKLKLLFSHAVEIVVPLSMVLSVMLYLFSDFIATYVFHNSEYRQALVIASFIIPFAALSNIGIVYIRGLKNLKVSEYLGSVNRPIINILLLLVLSLYISDKMLPLYTLGIAIMGTSILSLYFIVTKIRSIKIESKEIFQKKELLSTSLPLMVTSLAGFVMSNVALFFLETFSTTDQVGIFSVALKVALLISLALTVVNTISAPKFAELYWSEQYEALQKIMSQSSKLIFVFSFFPALLIMIFSTQIMSIFGSEFSSGGLALTLLVIGQVVNAATGSVGIFLNMTGHQVVLKNIVLVTLIINVLLNYILIPLYGIEGAAVTSMLSALFSNVYAAYYVRRKLNYTTFYIPWFLKELYEK